MRLHIDGGHTLGIQGYKIENIPSGFYTILETVFRSVCYFALFHGSSLFQNKCPCKPAAAYGQQCRPEEHIGVIPCLRSRRFGVRIAFSRFSRLCRLSRVRRLGGVRRRYGVLFPLRIQGNIIFNGVTIARRIALATSVACRIPARKIVVPLPPFGS